MKRPFALAALVAAAVVASCAGPSAPTTSSAASALATASPVATPIGPSATPAATLARLSGAFEVGEGRKLYLECLGSGSPTILLEAGDGESGPPHWRFVVPGLIGETRTCTYDRLGLGKSTRASGCRQLEDLLNDLDALLAAAALDGPYVLAAGSGGGFIMAGFAARHPEQVAGMVFVDVPKALTAELYPEVLPRIACDAPGNVERRDYLAVEHAAWDNRAELGDFPLVVISNDYGDSVEPGTDEATNVEDQRGWFDLSPDNATQVVVTSGHNIAANEPELVIEQILAVLETARASLAGA